MEFKPNKKLGFGLMRLPQTDPNDAAAVDIEQLKDMVDLFLERGFTYFDTAWMYNGFESERAVRKALIERHPRESFTLATKLHAAFIDNEEDRDKIFNEQLNKTGAGYFDYYLLHGVDEGKLKKYEELHCFEWLLDKKEKGLVKHCGFSFHDTPELLDKILTDHPEMEFVQLQVNYLDWNSRWIQSGKCYETACRHNKPVIIMEPVKGGTLARIHPDAEKIFKDYDPDMSVPSWAIRFIASLDNVMVVLSGMSNLAQIEDNTSYMEDFIPLTEEEKQMCFRVADVINAQIAVPCTGCRYCTDGCPMNIPIPDYFSLYNEDMREHLEEKGWTVNYSNYQTLTEKYGKASDCLQCGQCESVCPQHLGIIEYMKQVVKHYERR
ncbi:MAG: aldo/keto reductase [Erysipelotrichaceae bacterium]|nr:aldo/keto reductase [Erysipelotrichaceae bacterium]